MPRVMSTFLTIVLITLCGCVSKESQATSDRVYKTGDKPTDGIVDHKIEKNKELAHQFPRESKYPERIANLYWFSKKDHKNALRYLERAQEIEPKNAKFDLLEARIYYALGSYRAAESTYRRVIGKIGDDFTGPEFELAWLYMMEERFDEAERSFRRCLELDAKLAGAYYGLGKVAEARHDPEKTIEYLEKYLKLGGGINHRDAIRVLRRLQPELTTIR